MDKRRWEKLPMFIKRMIVTRKLDSQQRETFKKIVRILRDKRIKYDLELYLSDSNKERYYLYICVKNNIGEIIKAGTANGYPMVTLTSNNKLILRHKDKKEDERWIDFDEFEHNFMEAYNSFCVSAVSSKDISKKKTIIVIAIVCLIIAGVITAVIIRNNAVKESAGEEKAGNEDLANDDSMNKFGEAEDEPDTVYGSYTEADIDHYTDDGFVTKDGSYVITAPLDEREQAAWNTYQNYYDDFSNYGPDFDAPPIGTSGTGYDPSLLVVKTTDKGCECYVDTATGKVYYNGMVKPTGGVVDFASGGDLFIKWVLEDTTSRGQCTETNITYAQMQEIYGYPIN